MARPQAEKIVVIGAGAAGLIAAHELRRAGKRVTILEARDRCGGRIDPLPSAEFSPRPSSRWNTAAEYTPALCFLKRVRTELRTLNSQTDIVIRSATSAVGPKRRFVASQRYVRSWGLSRHAKTAQPTRLTQVGRDASALVGPRCAKSGPARGAFNWPRNSRSGLRLPYPSGHPGCSRASRARSSRNSCVSCL